MENERADAGRNGRTRLTRPNSQAQTGTGDINLKFSLLSRQQGGLAPYSIDTQSAEINDSQHLMVFTAFIEYTVSTSVFGVKCLLIFQKDNATTTPRIFVSYASSLIYPWNGCSVNVQYCINKGFPPTRMHDAFETRATLGEYSITLTSGALSLKKFNKSTHPATAAAVSTLFAMMYRRAGALCYVAHHSLTPPPKGGDGPGRCKQLVS